jgi:hypothetical protein
MKHREMTRLALITALAAASAPMQMMGSPLYGMPTLSFFEQTSIFRLDDTVERAEIVQGGPSAVW